MSSSTQEPIDEQVSPKLEKTVVPTKHQSREEVNKEFLSAPQSTHQVSTSILNVFLEIERLRTFPAHVKERYDMMQATTSHNELHQPRHRDALLLKLADWKPILLFTCLAIIIAGSLSSAYFFARLEQIRKYLSRLENLTAQIDSLASNTTPDENNYLNWFNFYLGARAIPSLSSPHQMNPAHATWWPPLRFPFRPPRKDISLEQELSDQDRITNPDGPNAPLVLMREEYKIAPYCVASGAGDEYSKLQLAIKTPRPIIPLELTMEHYPQAELGETGVKTRAVAPKQFELWVHIINPSTLAVVQQNITKLYPNILAIADPASQPYLKTDSAHPLDPSNWVPIGRWEFAMLLSPYKKTLSQKFRPQVNVEEVGFVTDMFLLRVNTNWGDSRNTCLARVRMRGLDRSANFEYLLRENEDL